MIATDLDQVVCWESPLINTSGAAPGTVGFSLDLKWEGFDSEPAGMNPPDLVADHIDVEYGCDGGPWQRLRIWWEMALPAIPSCMLTASEQEIMVRVLYRNLL